MSHAWYEPHVQTTRRYPPYTQTPLHLIYYQHPGNCATERAQSVKRRTWGWTAGVLFPAGARDLPALLSVRTISEAHPASYLVDISRGVKRPVPKADHAPPSCAEVKIDGAISPLLYTSSLIKHTEIFAFYFYPIDCNRTSLHDYRLKLCAKESNKRSTYRMCEAGVQPCVWCLMLVFLALEAHAE
jgi:hypothetical protein